MKCCVFLTVLLITVAPAAFGQALPAAQASPISTGFELPMTAGTLQYAVSASETLSWGYYSNSNSGTATATNLTGDLGYISNSKRDPFSMFIAGGHSWGSNSPSYNFVSLGLSQVLSAGRWTFLFSDSVAYMPGTSTTGLSGVPGVGDLGLTPVPVGPDTGQGILTDYSNRISNAASATISRSITGKTSFNATGSYAITRFLSGSGNASASGLDSNSVTAQGGISHQYSARNTLGGNYAYSYFTYPGYNFGLPTASFESQTASLQYIHQFTRKLSLNASSGPEWTTINLPGSSTSLSLYVDAALAYSGEFSRAALGYVRSTNAGNGVIGGSLSDAVSFTTSRTFARVWNCAFTSSYTHSSSLAGLAPYTFDTTLAGFQVSRAIGRSFSAFASYTLENQSSQGSAATVVDVFNGFSQVLGFGLTYAPMSIHFGHP
jgi:hypothetical protein